METLIVAIIEDSESDREGIVDHCNAIGEELDYEVEALAFGDVNGFIEDFKRRSLPPDVMIADLRLGEPEEDRSGWDAVKALLQLEVVPVLVYSAYADDEMPADLTNLFIVPVKKGSENFDAMLRRSFLLKLRLKEESERVRKQFSSLTLETVGKVLGEKPSQGFENLDENTLAAMAIARLASYLVNVPLESRGTFPPEAAFVVPPLHIEGYPDESLFLGDFVVQSVGDGIENLWVVVTPSCDIVFQGDRKPKVDDVLLLRCFRNWKEVPFLNTRESQDSRKSSLLDRINSGTAKMIRCPTAMFSADVVLISLKDYKTIPYNEIRDGITEGKWKRIATLASPYAESLQGLFITDLSRIGTPETSSRDEEKKWGKEFVKNPES